MVARSDVSALTDTLNEMYGLVSDYGDAAPVASLGWYLALRAEAVGAYVEAPR